MGGNGRADPSIGQRTWRFSPEAPTGRDMAQQAEEELLPIKDAADYLKKSEAYVLEKLRRRRFQQVIIDKKTSAGAPWRGHYYFKKRLWPFKRKEKVVKDSQGKAYR